MRRAIRIARLQSEAGAYVGAREELDVLLLDQVHADEKPGLLGSDRAPGERFEKRAPPGSLHSEQRIGHEQRPARQIEEAIEPVHFLDRLQRIERAPRDVALGALHAKSAV
jgi:hypothetical protein